jgi:ribosomal protein S25
MFILKVMKILLRGKCGEYGIKKKHTMKLFKFIKDNYDIEQKFSPYDLSEKSKINIKICNMILKKLYNSGKLQCYVERNIYYIPK